MTSYAGLEVSQQETQICVVDATGAVRWCGKARSEPAALAAVLRCWAPDLGKPENRDTLRRKPQKTGTPYAVNRLRGKPGHLTQLTACAWTAILRSSASGTNGGGLQVVLVELLGAGALDPLPVAVGNG